MFNPFLIATYASPAMRGRRGSHARDIRRTLAAHADARRPERF